jgi:hypothetical protein
MNRKGQMENGRAIFGILIVFGILIAGIIGFGLFAFFTNEIDKGLMSVEGDAGQVDFADAVDKTWGQYNDGLVNSLNLFAVMLFFGTFLGLMAVAYFNRGKSPLLFFLADIFIIFIAFIIAGYAADAYELLLGVDTLQEMFVQNMNLGAKLMLNLPIFVAVFGVLIMVISYVSIPRTREEQMAGF